MINAWTFAPGDKVMQIENDYDKEVYNGDIGYIDDVDPDAGELTACFDRLTFYLSAHPVFTKFSVFGPQSHCCPLSCIGQPPVLAALEILTDRTPDVSRANVDRR